MFLTMSLFLLLFTLFIPSALASEDVCEQMDYELNQAVQFEIIDEETRNRIYIRCLINYS